MVVMNPLPKDCAHLYYPHSRDISGLHEPKVEVEGKTILHEGEGIVSYFGEVIASTATPATDGLRDGKGIRDSARLKGWEHFLP